MIKFQDTLQQPQQAPSAQLKPVPVAKPQSIQPNLVQQGIGLVQKASKSVGDFIAAPHPRNINSTTPNAFGQNIVKGIKDTTNTVGKTIGNQPFILNPFNPKKSPTNLQVAQKVAKTSPVTNFLSGQVEKIPGQLKSDLTESYGAPKQNETEKQYLTRTGGATMGAVNFGFAKAAYSKAADYLAKTGDREAIRKIQDFVIHVQKTGGKKNYGEAGKEIQAMATDIFGEKARTLDNKQLANAFDATLQVVGKKGKFGLGLGTENVHEGQTAPSDPIAKITQALKEAKPLRAGQETAYTAERTQRIAAAQQAAAEAGGGKAGFEAKLDQLKGALSEPPKFEPLADKLQPEEVDHLHNLIDQNTVLLPFEKVAAGTGLNKLLTGRVPQEAELAKLHEVFGKEFVQAATGNLSTGQKIAEGAANVLNVPRALMSSVDFSAPLRQGVFAAARNPKEFGSAFVKQFKYFVSPKAYEELHAEIQSRPNYPKMRENKLALTDMGALNDHEEDFMSNLAEKLPLGIGKIVRASDRAYSGFLNKFRADLFDKMVKGAGELKADNPKFLKDMTEFINNATGRGSLTNVPLVGKQLQSASPLLNSVFFSPRLIASRVNLLNPVYYAKLEPTVRKEAIKTLLTFTTTGMSILGAAKLAGADVGTDPRSADFGKIKMGNTRYDIWGGFQQYAKLMGQLITGESVNSTTGKVYSLGQGYKPTTRKDIIQRFFESKFAPVPSFLNDVTRGSNSLGEPLEFTNPNPLKNPIGQRAIPFLIQDINDTINEYGEWGPVVSLPGLFGVGSQTYGGTTPSKNTRTRASTRTRKGIGTRIR